jgi:hypothetical protein
MKYKDKYESLCVEHEKLKEELESTKLRLQYYIVAVNKIDDSIEYRCRDSDTKNRIYAIFDELTKKIVNITDKLKLKG